MRDKESNNLESLITKQEAHSALNQMKNDKSPGSDGYTTVFFKFFFVDLGAVLWSVLLTMAFASGNVSHTKAGDNNVYT